MAEYPTYTVTDLANVSGNDASEYSERPDFVNEALDQATLLFQIGTCLGAFPDSPQDAKLARYAIVSMADAIYWSQPWQKVLRSPFTSETIGSYSYSKLSTAVSAGLPTGVSWFDLAVGRLGVCDFNPSIPNSGGINVFEEHKVDHGGYTHYDGPAERNRWDQQPPAGLEV